MQSKIVAYCLSVACAISMCSAQGATAPNAAAAASAAASASAPAPKEAVPANTFPGDGGSYVGDYLTFEATTTALRKIGDATNTAYCAPAGNVFLVMNADNENIYGRILETKSVEDAELLCDATPKAVKRVVYSISRAALPTLAATHTGISFGGLVVPFKVHLYKGATIASSATIAPYIGWRVRSLTNVAVSILPFYSAGLAIVPVVGSNGTISQKAAFSHAIGLQLSSTKNANFHAGFLIGKDFLNAADRASDPAASRTWFSLYLGYSA